MTAKHNYKGTHLTESNQKPCAKPTSATNRISRKILMSYAMAITMDTMHNNKQNRNISLGRRQVSK
jgi:hypothetical protein